MHKALELPVEKTLVPNVVCKSEFHKLINPQSLWIENSFITYSDLVPSHAKNIHSTWYFYQKINALVFDGHATLNKVLSHWQQTQFKVLNNHYDQIDSSLIKKLFESHAYHPSLFPYWFLNNPSNQTISILPYQWQPLENIVFLKNKWHRSLTSVTQLQNTNFIEKQIAHLNEINSHIDSSQKTLIIVSELNAYWLHQRHIMNAGIIDSKPLCNQPLVRTLHTFISESWNKECPKNEQLTTKSFKNKTLEYLTDFTANQTYTDLETIILKRVFKLIDDMSDDRYHALNKHLENLLIWLDAHQVSLYISHSNIMLTTPKHAFPYMYDACIIVNLNEKALDKLYFSPEKPILKLNLLQNDKHFSAQSNYLNSSEFKLAQTQFNVTDFLKFQRCPIIYVCQNKLKLTNEHASKIKMHYGIITHAVLADFWLLMKDQDTLKKHTADELKGILNTLIDKQIQTIDKEKAIDTAFWTFQQSHLAQLLQQWLMTEIQRTPFKVVAVEKQIHLEFKGKLIKGRVDRVDYIEGLGYLIIDYKTGHTHPIQATLDGFPDPQMLIYTKALEYDVVGIGYGLITTNQLKGMQFKDPNYDALPYYDSPNIDEIIQSHLDLFNDTLKPLPYEPRQCIKCDFQSICHHASSSK